MNRTSELTSIDQTIKGMRTQTAASLKYARLWLNGERDPQRIFYLLKASTTYKSDPKNIELLQKMETLFENNYWGISGAGDCDCFSIAFAACMQVVNIESRFVLAGRTPNVWVHVYNAIFFRGEWMAVDLTCSNFNVERPYKFTIEKKIL